MADLHVNQELLRRFEAGYDSRRPERSDIPARVLGHGRVTTVLTINQGEGLTLAFKRLSIFRSPEEADRYETLHRKYVRTLSERVGLKLLPTATVRVADVTPGRVVVYIVQEQVPEDTTGHTAIYHLTAVDVNRLLLAVLSETAKVFDFNRMHIGSQEIGFDPRLSNWTIVGFDPELPALSEHVRLAYLDTSTPLMRRSGQEQFDMLPFVRGMPGFVPMFIRRYLLNDMISRYYDFRRSVLDLIADLYSEGRSDLVPWLTDSVNWFFLAERMETHFRPLTVSEVEAHHRRDALYWRTYMTLRRLSRVLGK